MTVVTYEDEVIISPEEEKVVDEVERVFVEYCVMIVTLCGAELENTEISVAGALSGVDNGVLTGTDAVISSGFTNVLKVKRCLETVLLSWHSEHGTVLVRVDRKISVDDRSGKGVVPEDGGVTTELVTKALAAGVDVVMGELTGEASIFSAELPGVIASVMGELVGEVAMLAGELSGVLGAVLLELVGGAVFIVDWEFTVLDTLEIVQGTVVTIVMPSTTVVMVVEDSENSVAEGVKEEAPFIALEVIAGISVLVVGKVSGIAAIVAGKVSEMAVVGMGEVVGMIPSAAEEVAGEAAFVIRELAGVVATISGDVADPTASVVGEVAGRVGSVVGGLVGVACCVAG